MKKLLLSILFVSALIVNAQPFEKLYPIQYGNYTNEYANAGLELSNGNYLVAINNNLLCLSPSGDSLWSKNFKFYGEITKLFRDNNNQVIAATNLGKMVFLKINETNGDTIGSVKPPKQFSNSGYTIYDAVVLPGGDYVFSYNNGGGLGGIIMRFTPGATNYKWQNDYAGQNWGPRSICLDDTTLIIGGYKGVSSNLVDLYVRKLSINNTTIWSKQIARNAIYGDRLIGIQKNSLGNYLVATSFGINNKLVPAVAVIKGTNGDSLAVHSFSKYNGLDINYGYLTSLKPTANGFYAAGYLSLYALAPDNSAINIGSMSAFSMDDNGVIIGAKAFNKTAYYETFPNGPYAGAEGWGNGCFATSDGHYLLYGVCTFLWDPNNTGTPTTQWKGYVVKSNVFLSGINEVYKNELNVSVSPNPSNGLFNFYTETTNGLLKVVDVAGKKVAEIQISTKTTVLDLSTYAKGLYFYQIIAEQKASSGKLVVE